MNFTPFLKKGLLESEILFCIIVADVFNHLADERQFGCGQFAIFYFAAEDVTQDTAEVFVTRIRQEAA